MSRRLFLVSLLALAPFGGCGKTRSAPAPDMNELHGAFIAALKRLHWSEADAFETCVLGPDTIVYDEDREEPDPDRWERFRWRLPAIRRDTYDSYWSSNEKPRPIAPSGAIPMKVRVLTAAERAEFAAIARDPERDDYWKIFRDRYENAVRIRLSAPGFSRDGEQAVIYYEASFDVLAAWGSYCLLARKGERWEIAEEHCVWQS